MNSRRKSNNVNYHCDTESLNAKDLVHVIQKSSQNDNLEILDKEHAMQASTDKNGLWSTRNQQSADMLTSNRLINEELMNRIVDDDFDKNGHQILQPKKLNASKLEHRSNQYLNKRLPWYCESSSPIKWFKQYSNDQLPKVNYNQTLFEPISQPIGQSVRPIDQMGHQIYSKNPRIVNTSEPLINLETDGYANSDLNCLDSIQTFVKSNKPQTQPRLQQDHFRFFADQPFDEDKQRSDINYLHLSSMDKISKLQSTQNHFKPYRYSMYDHNYLKPQWRKMSLPNSHPHMFGNSKYAGSSRGSYGGRRSHTKNRFNLFNGFYKSNSINAVFGLNAMFADSSVPGVREICHSDGYFRKFLCMVGFVLFSVLALNDIQQLLSDFYSYPITVDMRMRESRKLPFPAVTICNLNIVRYSALCNSTLNVSMPVELQEKLCVISLSQMKNTSIEDINDILPDSDQVQTTKPPFDDYLNYDDEIANEQTIGPETTVHPKKKGKPSRRPNFKKQHRLKRSSSVTGSKSQNKPGVVPNVNSNLNKASSSPPEFNPDVEMFELTEREEKELQENLTTWLAVMANKNKNLTFTLGHQFDDMLLRCTIKSSNCTHPNFTPTEGNCYTFVAKTNMNPTHINQPVNTARTVPITSTTTETTEHTTSATTHSTSHASPPTTESMRTSSVKLNPWNPPLQPELFTAQTEPPDLSTTTRATMPPDRVDPGVGLGIAEQTGHHQVETILAGADHGLELVINLEKAEYLPGTSQIGALVMLHSPDDFGISASEAIMVSPECATYIGLKMVRISRLPAPYPEQCIDVWPKGLQRKSMLNVSYSQQACIKICLQRTIQNRCKCQSAFLEQVELNGTDFRICDTRKRTTRRCVEEVMLRPENKLEDCKCPPRCQVIQYEKTVSTARWPTREDRVSFDRGTKDINISNVAKVVVYFQTMTLQEVTQQAAWTTAKLFSSLGGFMGLHVGFSFLSLFEVFEILCRRSWYGMTRRTPKFKVIAKAVLSAIVTKNSVQKNSNLNLA